MSAEGLSCRAGGGRVVHLVGQLTDGVFGFLGPVTTALAQSGADQVVVLFDDAGGRHLLPRFHEAVELVFAPGGPSRLRRWWTWREVAREALGGMPLKAVHLHGVLPCVLGTALAREARLGSSLFWSPRPASGSRPLALTAAVLLWLLRLLAPSTRWRALTNGTKEAAALADVVPQGWLNLVESPLPAVFFEAPRNEARYPLIVTSGYGADPRGEEAFAQAAVLLGGDELHVTFNWIGDASEVSRPRLKAAGVDLFDVADDAERASRLASSWMYLAPDDLRSFPYGLAAGMALGLPCVALDTVEHRELVRHGETGYLWRTERDLMHHVAALIDDAPLRARVGRAAREEARRRFGEHAFRDSLLHVYEMPLR